MVSAIEIHEAPGHRTTRQIERALRDAPEASPELLESRQLLRRMDTKFLLEADQVGPILSSVADAYAPLRVSSGAAATYRSLYFDTPDLRCFHDHRRGRRLRYKARVRHYPDRRRSFFEVKCKRNKVLTIKHRLEVPYGAEVRGRAVQDFLRGHLGAFAEDLTPSAYVDYRRVSLLGVSVMERVTVDFDVRIAGPRGHAHRFDGLAIIEVKQPSVRSTTPIMRALAAHGVGRRGLSKYVAAIATTHPTVRKNRLLPGLRALERITS